SRRCRTPPRPAPTTRPSRSRAVPGLAGAGRLPVRLELEEVREQRTLRPAPEVGLHVGVDEGYEVRRAARLAAERREHLRLALEPVGDQRAQAANGGALRRAVRREEQRRLERDQAIERLE